MSRSTIVTSTLVAATIWTLSLLTLANAAVPLTHYESVMLKLPKETGLYNASDKVNVLTDVNFNSVVLEQKRSVLVEFYNSYCGHCKRFAPFYKELAAQLHPWRDVLLITAIDCASEENNGICREYEVMSYPTLRYFSPGFKPAEKSYGHDIQSQIVDELRANLALLLAAENRSLLHGNNSNWPDLQPLSDYDGSVPFKGLGNHVQLIIGIYDADNTSTMAIETILHYVQWPDVSIRRIVDASVASAFKIEAPHKLASIDRHGKVTPYTLAGNASYDAIAVIEGILQANHIERRKSAIPDLFGGDSSTTISSSSSAHNKVPGGAGSVYMASDKIIAEVLRNKHAIYQADLEMAVRVMLFNEVPKASNMSDERVVLLRRLLKMLVLFNPLSAPNSQLFLSELSGFVEQKYQNNHTFTAKDFETEAHRLEAELQPVFAPSVGYVGCMGSRPGLRGYTCSLWTLFHYLTVQMATTEKFAVMDPQEVLRVVWGYVRFFFGCTDCSEHFQELSQRDRIWYVSSRDGVILWLWTAHNSVNKRLAGDATEDPLYKKRQFPTINSCSACYKSPPNEVSNTDGADGTAGAAKADEEIDWNRDGVLTFLKDIYNAENIKRFGIDEVQLQHAVAQNLRQKRMTSGSVFSEMDMRMGMLLYGFCIVMMVVAFKLFVFKGYRKKSYSHDLLGKV